MGNKYHTGIDSQLASEYVESLVEILGAKFAAAKPNA